MKEIVDPQTLKNENPELFSKVKEAHELIVPHILSHVYMTLKDQNLFSAAVHATFIKIVDDDTNKKFFVEIQTTFTKFMSGVWPQLTKVIFYDTLEEYDTERKNVEAESVRKYGNGNFPAFKDFGGKMIPGKKNGN